MTAAPTSRRAATWILAALALALAGCSAAALAKKMAPQDVQAASEETMADLRAAHYDALNHRLVAALRVQDHSADFRRMAAFIPPDGELGSHIAGFFFQTGTAGARYDITYEYQFAHTWVVARFAWVRDPAGLALADLHVNSQADSLEEQTAFTLRGLQAPQVTVLILGPLAALFSLCVLVKCIRTPQLRRKWLWVIFILVGFGGFNVNWATAQWSVGFFELRLLSFSAFAMAGQPWVLTVSVPVGAVVFLDHLRKRKAAAATPPSALP
jgi:hypothetical protein